MFNLYLLFDFTEGESGIGTVSSIFKPVLPDNVMEQFAQLNSLMTTNAIVIAR